jgi:hypothetical protein
MLHTHINSKTCNDTKGYFYPIEQINNSFCGTGGYDVHGPAEECDCCGEDVGGNKMCIWQDYME